MEGDRRKPSQGREAPGSTRVDAFLDIQSLNLYMAERVSRFGSSCSAPRNLTGLESSNTDKAWIMNSRKEPIFP